MPGGIRQFVNGQIPASEQKRQTRVSKGFDTDSSSETKELSLPKMKTQE